MSSRPARRTDARAHERSRGRTRARLTINRCPVCVSIDQALSVRTCPALWIAPGDAGGSGLASFRVARRGDSLLCRSFWPVTRSLSPMSRPSAWAMLTVQPKVCLTRDCLWLVCIASRINNCFIPKPNWSSCELNMASDIR